MAFWVGRMHLFLGMGPKLDEHPRVHVPSLCDGQIYPDAVGMFIHWQTRRKHEGPLDI